MAHSILPPSSAGIWGKCDGWVNMSMFYPEEYESEASIEGTAAHELASATIFAQGRVDGDSDMALGAKLYAEDVLSVYSRRPHTMIRVEQSVAVPRIHAECFGTPDADIWDDQKKVLFIWDYKYGMMPIEVFENEQLVTYAAGLLDKYGCDELNTKIVFRIVQPRAFHRDGVIREWVVMAHELRGQINRLANSAQANMSGGSCRSGDHCRYCFARSGCEAAQKAGIALYEQVSTPVPMSMSNEDIGTFYSQICRAEKQIELLKSGIATEMMARIKAGSVIPNWSLERKAGNRKWMVSNEELFEYGDLLGINLRASTAPISPTQFEKANPIAYGALEAMVGRPLGNASLTPIDNKKIREVFSK